LEIIGNPKKKKIACQFCSKPLKDGGKAKAYEKLACCIGCHKFGCLDSCVMTYRNGNFGFGSDLAPPGLKPLSSNEGPLAKLGTKTFGTCHRCTRTYVNIRTGYGYGRCFVLYDKDNYQRAVRKRATGTTKKDGDSDDEEEESSLVTMSSEEEEEKKEETKS
jgi:hypothetical protein